MLGMIQGRGAGGKVQTGRHHDVRLRKTKQDTFPKVKDVDLLTAVAGQTLLHFTMLSFLRCVPGGSVPPRGGSTIASRGDPSPPGGEENTESECFSGVRGSTPGSLPDATLWFLHHCGPHLTALRVEYKGPCELLRAVINLAHSSLLERGVAGCAAALPPVAGRPRYSAGRISQVTFPLQMRTEGTGRRKAYG